MSKLFTQVQNEHINSNTFDLSHDRKLSFRIGDLVPINIIEVIPGDKFNIQTSQMIRFAPLVAPIMHQSSVYTHYFFVPNRLLWSNWEDFITGGPDGTNNSTHPYLPLDDVQVGSLADYFGIPTDVSGGNIAEVNALPFAAYNKIYNDYYRDENLVTPLADALANGNNQASLFTTLQKRAWQHDYFTSSLPWTQKGPEATIPLGTTAPILFTPDGVKNNQVTDLSGTILGATTSLGATSTSGDLYGNIAGNPRLLMDNSDTLTADLSQATASTIIDLRRAFKLQEFLEKNARGGSRYIETIMSHFGVKSSDARLQRPEFLGGNSAPMQISEVLQTTPATDNAPGGETTPQGNMAGHGISVGGSANINYKVEEHGFIIGIQSFLPKSAYQQGLPKLFSKSDKFDYYWPSFAHIGEQPIYNKEIYLQNEDEDDEVFGYTPRYAEYKFINSSVHGEYRTTLDFWHMGRKFASKPSLNQDFIECDHDEVSRIFAVTQSEQLYCHVYNKVKATRKMPFFGSPKM